MEEPRLEQFGLTKDEYSSLSKKEDNPILVIVLICAVLGFFVAGIRQFFEGSYSDGTIARRMGILLIFALGGAAGGAAAGGMIISPICLSIRDRCSKKYRKLKEYKAAKEKYDLWWARNQEFFWTSLDGKQFEYELAFLYSKLGYKVEFPKPGEPDKGVDFKLRKDRKTIAVQCKAHKKPVGPHAIRDLHGTMINHNADQAILASVSGFTSGVLDYALGKPIELVSLAQILRMRKLV